MINNRKIENNYFLVHYFKENSGVTPSFNNPTNSEITEDKNTQETRSIPNFSPSNYGYNKITFNYILFLLSIKLTIKC